MISNPWHEHPTWGLIENALRREWHLACVALWAGAGISVVMAIWLGSWWIAASLSLILGAAACLYYLHSSGHYRHSILWFRLRHEPAAFTWVYAVATQRMPFGFFISEQYRITLACMDGKRFDLRVRSSEYRAVMLLLERTLPEAAFGWSRERQRVFERDPNALRRDQGSDARKH